MQIGALVTAVRALRSIATLGGVLPARRRMDPVLRGRPFVLTALPAARTTTIVAIRMGGGCAHASKGTAIARIVTKSRVAVVTLVLVGQRRKPDGVSGRATSERITRRDGQDALEK